MEHQIYPIITKDIKKGPCKGCTDRKQGGGCHSTCGRYQRWKRHLEEEKEAKNKAKFMDGVHAESVKRIQKMYRKGKK